MEHDVKKYINYKRGIVLMLAASGVWPNYKPHPPALRVFLNICSVSGSGFTFYCIANFCIHNASNIKTLTSCLGLMVGFLSSLIKVIILPMHRDKLQSLNEGVSAMFESHLKVVEFRCHLLAHFRTFSKCFHALSGAVGVSTLLLIIMPLLASSNGQYIRMYPELLPFSYDPGGVIHWSIYIFETCSAFYLWSVTCGVDSVFGLYALHMVGELRLLSSRFRILKSSEKYRDDLKNCINSHVHLMETRDKLQEIFGFLTIWLGITCAIALCALAFQALQAKQSSRVKVIYLSGHCILKIVQAYSYAWYGNIIAIESDACQSAIYESQWPGCGDKRFMSDVFTVLLQKPMIFTAKKFVPLLLDAFLKIVNTTVSYFFLLRTLDESY